MKLYIYIFIILSIYISNCIGTNFINLHVYSDSDCKTIGSYGYGYSVAVDTCTSLDYVNNIILSISDDGKYVEYTRYQLPNSAECNVTVGEKKSYKLGSCVSYEELKLDSLNNANNQPYYYKVSSSNKVSIQSNSLASLYMKDNCDKNNIIVSNWYLNGTTTTTMLPGTDFLFFCLNNQPYYTTCVSNDCNPPRTVYSGCLETNAFYNSSSDYFSSTGAVTTGLDTGGSGSGLAKSINDIGNRGHNPNPDSGSSGYSGSGYSTTGDSNSINTGSSYSASGTGALTGSSNSGSSLDQNKVISSSSSSSTHKYYFQQTCY